MSLTQIIAGSHNLCLVRITPREQAKAILKNRGWSYRAAAAQLGVSYQHLSEVLNGWRTSQSLLSKISALPQQAAN